jgi:putative ABC transport system permease protein
LKTDVPQWKREQFPNMKYDEYTMKGAMTNTDEWRFLSKEKSIKYDLKR